MDALSAASLVGRERQLDELSQHLEHGAGSVVTGPPGSGVSALLIALVQAERSKGRRVVHRLASVGPSSPSDGDERALLVIDDAHLLSAEAADELRELLLGGDVQVVLGSTGRPLVEPLGWLWRSGMLARIDVAPLGADQVAAMIERSVGAPPDRPTVDAFEADSGGPPRVPRRSARGRGGRRRAVDQRRLRPADRPDARSGRSARPVDRPGAHAHARRA